MSVGPYRKTKTKQIFTNPKYRNNQFKYKNVMFNPQILRGKTFLNRFEFKKQNLEKNSKFKNVKNNEIQIINPYQFFELPPQPGKENSSTMTETYKEILEDHTEYREKNIQTEPLLNRPTKENFVEFKNGIDQETQILREDFLINFEQEIQSVLRVLLNKILEESRMELLEEIEIENMNQQRKLFQQTKMKLLNQIQKIKAKEQRIEEEIQRRKRQEEISASLKQNIHQKIVSRMFSKKVVLAMESKSLQFFDDQNLFFETENLEFYINFLPFLYQTVFYQINQQMMANDIPENFKNIIQQEKMQLHQNAIQNFMKIKFEKNFIKEKEIEKQKLEREQRRQIKREQKRFDRENKEKEKIKEILIKNSQIINSNFIIQTGFKDFNNKDKKIIQIYGGFLEFLNFFKDILQQHKKNLKEKVQLLMEFLNQQKITIQLELREFDLDQIFTKETIDRKIENVFTYLFDQKQKEENIDQQIIFLAQQIILNYNVSEQINDILILLLEIQISQQFKIFSLKDVKDLIQEQFFQKIIIINLEQKEPENNLIDIKENEKMKKHQVLETTNENKDLTLNLNFKIFQFEKEQLNKYIIHQKNLIEMLLKTISQKENEEEKNMKLEYDKYLTLQLEKKEVKQIEIILN